MIRICHISDFHIRNFKRHDEYRKSYEFLYESLREKKPDVIVFTGDLAHTKIQISPEFVQLCSELLKNLVEIAPLVLILGNHDCSLNNTSRLDALTPIVEAIDHPNVFLYKKSGVYPLPRALNGNIAVFSCFDDSWPTVEDVRNLRDPINNQVTIGLYHGFIKNAELANGILIEDAPPVSDFLNIVDYLLLGDLHNHQIVEPNFKAAYAGSYPQQNFSEDPVYKGYLLWDIKDRENHEVNFVTLPNVHPFYTLKLDNDDVESIPKNLKFQKEARIRVLSRQLSIFEKNIIKGKIDDIYKPCEINFLDEINPYRQELKISSVDARVEDVTEVSVQERLIKNFFKFENLEKDLLDDIFEINRRINVHVKKQDETLRNVQYRLGKMIWSNVFSYGEDNEFDFSKRKGLVGIFGKNGTGKSSLAVDIPLYCLFNKVAKKVTKNDLIINENKESCFAGIEVFLDKDVYSISRKTNVYLKSGKKNGVPVYQGKTEVDFSINGKSRNGIDRFNTDLNIRKVFGAPEDFMATSVAPQWQLLNFINLGGTERQKMIGRYFGVDIFDKKHLVAKEEFKGIKAKIDVLEEKNFESDIRKYQRSLLDLSKEIEENKKLKKWQEDSKCRLEENIENLQKQIINIELDSDLTEEILNEKIEKQKLEIVNYKKEFIENQKRKEEKAKIGNLITLKEEKSAWKEINELRDRAAAFERSCNCKHEEGCSLLKKIVDCRNEADNRAKLLPSESEVEEKIKKYLSIKLTPGFYDDTLIKMSEEILDGLLRAKERFIKNKEQLVKNAEIEKKLEELKFRKKKVNEALQETLKKATSLSVKEGAIHTLLNELKSSQSDYEALRGKYRAYSYYIQAMSKDGISKSIIADNLNIINGEMKKILTQGVKFGIELESSNSGKEIEIYFKHEKCPKRNIELCSGMEQSIAAIAIRAALISITTLPKSNVYVLDECFSTLDPEYMAGLVNILEYLKQLFETVIIITHIDSFQDIVDHVIEIERDDKGYARICE